MPVTVKEVINSGASEDHPDSILHGTHSVVLNCLVLTIQPDRDLRRQTWRILEHLHMMCPKHPGVKHRQKWGGAESVLSPMQYKCQVPVCRQMGNLPCLSSRGLNCSSKRMKPLVGLGYPSHSCLHTQPFAIFWHRASTQGCLTVWLLQNIVSPSTFMFKNCTNKTNRPHTKLSHNVLKCIYDFHSDLWLPRGYRCKDGHFCLLLGGIVTFSVMLSLLPPLQDEHTV